MVRLESLLYLQEIAKYKSINKAADKLFYLNPRFPRQLKT